jgi:hypothetical protein
LNNALTYMLYFLSRRWAISYVCYQTRKGNIFSYLSGKE